MPVTSRAWQLLIAGSLDKSVKKIEKVLVDFHEIWYKCIIPNVF